MKVVNLTPYEITLISGEKKVSIPSSGVLRMQTKEVEIGNVDIGGISVPVVEQQFLDKFELNGEEINFSELVKRLKDKEKEDILVIVSLPVLEGIKSLLNGASIVNNVSFVRPDTSPQGAMRDKQGKIIGVKRFSK